MKTSPFAKWFEQQFGKDPLPTIADYRKALDKRIEGHRSDALIRLHREYAEKREAALSAWMARERVRP